MLHPKMASASKYNWALAFALLSCAHSIEPQETDRPDKQFFRTIVNDRFFIQSADIVEFIVLRSRAEQDSFLAAKKASRSIAFSAYQDSLVVGIIYGRPISISCFFMIDSIVVNSTSKQVIVSSHVLVPSARMSLSAIHSHFVALPKMDFPITMAPVSIYEEPKLDTIPFITFMKGSDRFLTPDASKNFLFLFPSKEAENMFLDTIPQTITPPLVSFGPFNYNDSMIVGVVSRQFNHITPFEILALVNIDGRTEVHVQSFDSQALPAISRPYHFVALRKQQLPYALKELQRVDSWID